MRQAHKYLSGISGRRVRAALRRMNPASIDGRINDGLETWRVTKPIDVAGGQPH
jgi:hypothetical protein